MDKIQIKNILISMRNEKNEEIVNNLLGKIDMMDDSSLQSAIKQVGKSEEAIRKFFKKKIEERKNSNLEEHKSINRMFSYGISGNCIHLHLPTDLHQMLENKGISGTIDTVNLYLLDAIERIRGMKEDGYYRFQGKDNIYMISPILLGRELKFLKKLDFETKTYKRKQLNDESFVKETPEAMLAINIFGKDKNVGIAKIDFKTLQSEVWQEKRKSKLKEFASRGISLNDREINEENFL